MISSPQQTKILEDLLPVASIALKGYSAHIDLRPRTHTLICAPSGAGKSHIMRELGNILKVRVLSLNVSTWQPIGSSSNNYTWNHIVDFLKENDRGIVVLDELDKLDGVSDWLNFVLLEIHDLLDGIIPMPVDVRKESGEDEDLWIESDEDSSLKNMKYRSDLQKKLRTRVFIVGGGAWQSLWQKEDGEQNRIGFIAGAVSENVDIKIDHKLLQASIASELLKRFRYEVLLMKPMGEIEYLQMLPEFLKSISIDLREDFRNFAESQMSEAVKNKIGMRFFEEILTQALIGQMKALAIAQKLKSKKFVNKDETNPF